jgi:PilZ domain
MRLERRKNFRVIWKVPATIYDVERHLERPCILNDLSSSGARLSGVRANTIPDEFRLRTPLGDRHSCYVVWRTDNELGVRFADCSESDLSREEKEVASPQQADSSWLRRR